MPLAPNDPDDGTEMTWLAWGSLVFMLFCLGIAIYVIVTTGGTA